MGATSVAGDGEMKMATKINQAIFTSVYIQVGVNEIKSTPIKRANFEQIYE